MTSTLHYLHQNLYQLKSSKLMENRTFRELYDSAKDHEKNANLNSLISRNKRSELDQETDFYLILTKMLHELRECNEHDTTFTVNMEKIYKWYLQNKSKTSKSRIGHRDKPIPSHPQAMSCASSTFRSNTPTIQQQQTQLQQQAQQQQSKSTARQLRNSQQRKQRAAAASPALMANQTLESESLVLKSRANSAQRKSRQVSPSATFLPRLHSRTSRLDDAYDADGENDEKKATKNPSAPVSDEQVADSAAAAAGDKAPDEPTSTSNEWFFEGDDDSEIIALDYHSSISQFLSSLKQILDQPAAKFDDESRHGIVKALSQYATQLYADLDMKDTKKLENNLKSLNKFYHETVSDDNSNVNSNALYPAGRGVSKQLKSSITVQTLVDMAKEVSDKMILSKMKADVRMNENKMLLQGQSGAGYSHRSGERVSKDDNNTDTALIEDSLRRLDVLSDAELGALPSIQLPFVSIQIKNPSTSWHKRRPKSTSIIDWRGHVSRPHTPKHPDKLSIGSFSSYAKYPAMHHSKLLGETTTDASDNDEHSAWHQHQQQQQLYQQREREDTQLSTKSNKRRASHNNKQQRLMPLTRSASQSRSRSRSRLTRSTHPYSLATLSTADTSGKEVKFVSFVLKIDDSAAAAAAAVSNMTKQTSQLTAENVAAAAAAAAGERRHHSPSTILMTETATDIVSKRDVNSVVPPPSSANIAHRRNRDHNNKHKHNKEVSTTSHNANKSDDDDESNTENEKNDKNNNNNNNNNEINMDEASETNNNDQMMISRTMLNESSWQDMTCESCFSQMALVNPNNTLSNRNESSKEGMLVATECEECRKLKATHDYLKYTKKLDIFHLTAMNHDTHMAMGSNEKRADGFMEPTVSRVTITATATHTNLNNLNNNNNNSNSNSNEPIGLGEILLNNYDARFASRIGIHNSLPTQLISRQLDELQFIPYQQIDSRYPKVQGNPLFYPEYGKTVRKLYRTNPSIPRPESRHGSRSNMYDRVINYKREQLLLSMNEVTTASNAISNQLTVAATAAAATNRRRLAMLDVWQPEDVHLISDILNIENESLNEVLNVQSLKADFGDEADNMIVDLQKQYFKYETNTHITPMGRPVNTHPHRRWRSMWYSSLDEPNNAHLAHPTFRTPATSAVAANRVSFQPTPAINHRQSQLSIDYVCEGRPIPVDFQPADPVKSEQKFDYFEQVKKSVHVPTIFKGTTAKNYVKELNLEEREKREEQRRAAIKIQQTYRQHLQDKRFIESRSPLTDAAREWARNYKAEMTRRKKEKEQALLNERQTLELANLKLKKLIKSIGMHVDMYQILNEKGPEYTKKVLSSAAICIQRWMRGWLVRHKLKHLKEGITKNGTLWTTFITRFQGTVRRILKIRGNHRNTFEFNTHDVMDFYLKEQKYISYFNRLAFGGELDMNDLEKMFNFIGLYPNSDEIKEAKFNVFKYHKTKLNQTSLRQVVALDTIYYIYPPIACNLRSTRKSTWCNPVVNGEDALRLKGSKLIEPAKFAKVWKLVRKLSPVQSVLVNTPVERDSEKDSVDSNI